MNIISWRTAIIGVATFLCVLGDNLIGLVDGDPGTSFELDEIMAAIGIMLAGFAARDNSVSDEKAGAK